MNNYMEDLITLKSVDKNNESKILAEIILKEMTEKELPRIILDKALKIVDEKFFNDATI